MENDFARRLTVARENAKLSIAGVAYIVGVLIEEVKAWEAGTAEPSASAYMRLCMAFPELRDEVRERGN